MRTLRREGSLPHAEPQMKRVIFLLGVLNVVGTPGKFPIPSTEPK